MPDHKTKLATVSMVSAHTLAQLAGLNEAGREMNNESTRQLVLDLDTDNNVSTTSDRRAKGSASRPLIDTFAPLTTGQASM